MKTIVKEFPQRYIARGSRNWALLNHDGVRLVEKLEGILPTRNNVLPLLHDIVTPRIDQETLPLYYNSDDNDNVPLAACESCVLPQKRLLEEQYWICFFLLHTPNDQDNYFPTDTLGHFKIPNKNKILNWQSNCNMSKTWHKANAIEEICTR